MTLLRLRPAALAAIAVLPLALAGCNKGSGEELPPASGQGAPPLPELPAVAAADKPVETGGSDRTIGTTVPIERAEVAPNMSAIIDKIVVEEGDMVKKGQLLFRLRTSDLSLRVDQARAAEKSARVALAAAKVEFDRMQRLLEKNAVEQAQYDRVKAQYEAAQVGAEQAKVAVSLARRMLSDATVKSPISGVVTAVPKNEGEMATMMPPTVVVVVEDQSVLELRFRLPESSLATARVGDVVTAQFEAIKVKREAKIARISPAVDPRTRTVEVVANLDNKDGQLKSGMMAVVDLAAAPGAEGAGDGEAEVDVASDEAAAPPPTGVKAAAGDATGGAGPGSGAGAGAGAGAR
ncbi:MAG TPA: efflux RND transporter periplasmic adaptor subunit [Kofleriaceae bacterium]|nr:efflux RND transporter periplasmic adaptor subunit [Kofleriaceae bacterium]